MLAVLLMHHKLAKRRNIRSKKLQKIQENENILKICRMCLNTENLVPLFHNKVTEQKRSEDLRLVTGLEIKMNDGLSQKICTDCVEALTTALQFRNRCRDAEERQIAMLADLDREEENEELEPLVMSLIDHDYVMKNNTVDIEKPKASGLTPNGTYKCHICAKEYRNKSTFRAHVGLHTNFYICEVCGIRTSSHNILLQHKRARHGLTRIHHCSYCDYSAAIKDSLTIHERTHTGERPYICDHCGATFHRRSNLVQHIGIHSTHRNFECHICRKREKSKRLLTNHIFKVHKEKKYRYSCPVCHDVFSRPSSARLHLSSGHGLTRDQQGEIEKIEIKLPATNEE